MRECVTHHYACDCREETFKEMENQLKEALSIIEELKTSNETCFKLTYLAFGYLKSLGWDGFEMDSEEFMSCENLADALFKSTETKQSTDQRIEKLKKEVDDLAK